MRECLIKIFNNILQAPRCKYVVSGWVVLVFWFVLITGAIDLLQIFLS